MTGKIGSTVLRVVWQILRYEIVKHFKYYSYKDHTWLAIMYNRRLYAAPCQAVFAKTPVILIILLFKEIMRYNLMIYWKRAIRSSMSLPCSDDEYLIAGITDQIMICKKEKKKVYQILRLQPKLRTSDIR